MASKPLEILALALTIAGIGLLGGCGDEPTTAAQNPAQAAYSSYPGSTAAYPTTTTGSNLAGNVYGTPTSACGQTATTPSAGATQGTLAGQPAAAVPAGCAQTATPAQPATSAKSGMEATIAERKESGIFSKSLKSITVNVTNNDATSQTKFLIVAFTKKNNEVEVQYKSLTMSPGGTATYTFSASKDADDAKVELRDSLL